MFHISLIIMNNISLFFLCVWFHNVYYGWILCLYLITMHLWERVWWVLGFGTKVVHWLSQVAETACLISSTWHCWLSCMRGLCLRVPFGLNWFVSLVIEKMTKQQLNFLSDLSTCKWCMQGKTTLMYLLLHHVFYQQKNWVMLNCYYKFYLKYKTKNIIKKLTYYGPNHSHQFVNFLFFM